MQCGGRHFFYYVTHRRREKIGKGRKGKKENYLQGRNKGFKRVTRVDGENKNEFREKRKRRF